MREFATPPTYQAAATATSPTTWSATPRDHPRPCLQPRETGRGRQEWRDVTAAEFRDQVTAVANGLIAAGLGPGDRVALMSRTRYEWTLLDYAIWCAGGVPVPIYETSRPTSSAGSSPTPASRSPSSRPPSTASGSSRARPDGAVGRCGPRRGRGRGAGRARRRLPRRGGGRTPRGGCVRTRSPRWSTPRARPAARRAACSRTATSCSSWRSRCTGSTSCSTTSASTLLFLPLAHIFARVVQVGAVRTRVAARPLRRRRAPGARPAGLPAHLRPGACRESSRRCSTPRARRPPPRAAAGSFDRATDVAIAYSRATDEGRAGPLLRCRHRFFDRLVYCPAAPVARRPLPLRRLGRCAARRAAGSLLPRHRGDGPRGLWPDRDDRRGHRRTCPDAHQDRHRGPSLGRYAVRVAEDGELQVRGGQVFSGYWGNDEATSDVSRLTGGCAPATSARSTTRGSSG